MPDENPRTSPAETDSTIYDRMIPLAGIVLVLFATAMFGLFPRTLNYVLIAIALFGVGCATLWFGLSHADAQKTRNRIDRIRTKSERIQDLINKSRK